MNSKLAAMEIPSECHAAESMSETTAQTPSPKDLSFLDLPFEIRLKIYTLLFYCSVPMHPFIRVRREEDEPHSPPDDDDDDDDDFEFSPPPPQPKPLLPMSFLLTNRQIHDEASTVLWSTNRFLLQLPLNYEAECLKIGAAAARPWQSRPYDRGVMPTASQLRLIRHLGVEIYVIRNQGRRLDEPARLAAEVASELAALVRVLRVGGHELRHLEIGFTNLRLRCFYSSQPSRSDLPFRSPRHGQLPPAEVGQEYPAMWTPACCGWRGRYVCGERIEKVGQIQGLCRRGMRVDGRVLAAFGELRGIKNVTIVGRVEEAWAEWLRRAMMLEEGVEVEPYVEAEVGLDGLPVVQGETVGTI